MNSPLGAAERLRELEAENAELRKRLETVAPARQTIFGLSDALVACSAQGAIEYLNSAAEQLFKVSRSAVAGKPLTALSTPDFGGVDFSFLIAEAIEGGRGSAVRQIVKQDGSNVRAFQIKASVTNGAVQILISDHSALKQLEQTLARYISPTVMEQVLKAGVDPFKVRKYELTVLFADLRGFTSMSSRLSAEQVKTLIDEYLTVQIDVVLNAGATIDKIVGDELMALFGAPLPKEDHALWAINTALQMRQAHLRLMEVWQRRGVAGCPLGIGINSGEMVVGNIGSHRRMDYTVLGHHVNLGARLCSHAKAGEILMSRQSFEHAKATLQKNPASAWRPIKFKQGESIVAKGISEPVETIVVVEA